MKLILAASEVSEAVNLARANASPFCTNFFPAPCKLQGWIDHAELFYESEGDGFLRHERDF